jgi:hypothetical protein
MLARSGWFRLGFQVDNTPLYKYLSQNIVHGISSYLSLYVNGGPHKHDLLRGCYYLHVAMDLTRKLLLHRS